VRTTDAGSRTSSTALFGASRRAVASSLGGGGRKRSLLAGRGGGGGESCGGEDGLDEGEGREEKDTVRDGAKSHTYTPTSAPVSLPLSASADGGRGRMMNLETPRAEDWAWSCGRRKWGRGGEVGASWVVGMEVEVVSGVAKESAHLYSWWPEGVEVPMWAVQDAQARASDEGLVCGR
jgi:hypothetical protein